MADDHPFCDLFENVHASGIKTTVVKLKCMEKGTLNHMLSDLLCLPPRVLTPLSDIVYTKTKGNPLFVSQLMLSLNRDGLLRLSLSRRRWVWDIEEIQSMKLPEDVALCFANGISKLPLEVQSALRILSMFGASTKCKYIKALESQLDLKLIEPLGIAASEGLVSNMRGSFQFCHDRLQEASYALMEVQDRCRDHLRFGLCLVKLSLDIGDNDMLFTAVNQINFGGPSAVFDAQEYTNMAKYNLTAGKSAMDMSDFLSAYSFFSFGIDFLPFGHWTDHYHLSLELYDLASKSALATGNICSLRILSDQVLENARGFEDKLNTYSTIISSLACASKMSEALEKGHKILSQLGEDIPIKPSDEALDQYIQQTQSLIRGISENDILNFRPMTDRKKLVSMKFLAQLEIITLMVKPDLHPFVTLKMVQLTILYGKLT
jgi:predicted ATPase